MSRHARFANELRAWITVDDGRVVDKEWYHHAHGSHTPGQFSTFVKMLSGASWSNLSSPNADGAANSNLNGVSCAGASSCFAVGESGPGGSFTHTLVESYS